MSFGSDLHNDKQNLNLTSWWLSPLLSTRKLSNVAKRVLFNPQFVLFSLRVRDTYFATRFFLMRKLVAFNTDTDTDIKELVSMVLFGIHDSILQCHVSWRRNLLMLLCE